MQNKFMVRFKLGLAGTVSTFLLVAATNVFSAGTNETLIDILLKKGILSQDEAKQVQTEAAAASKSGASSAASKWKISDGIKSVELFGDLRLRYEYRSAWTPLDNALTQRRLRYALRFGLRGDLYDDFYYGFRLETSSNPRSTWATFANSSTAGTGPYGKSTGAINVGQIYLGWRPESWFDITAGKMPQPLYTTSLVWDGDLNPEGVAEHFKYTAGPADLFANFGQFIYQEFDPNSASPGLGFNGLTGQNPINIWQFAWQAGLNYRIDTNMSAKMAATFYHYVGVKASSATSGSSTAPYFGDPFVGEGAFTGSSGVNGASGSGTSGGVPGHLSAGFPVNQVGLNHLLVLDIPAEFNLRLGKVDTKLFGDFAYNLEGRSRAQDAAAGYAVYLANAVPAATISSFSPQYDDVKAYQVGFAVGSVDSLGLVSGGKSRRNAWEFRTFWQHLEQYALDPNLIDSDLFEGRGNLEGIYGAFAYGLSANMISTVRAGYATRINKKLGTGGSNQDIPWVNPISKYELLQLDFTYRF